MSMELANPNWSTVTVEKVCGEIPNSIQIGSDKYGFIYHLMPGDAVSWLCEKASEWARDGEKLMLALAPPDGQDNECVYVCTHVCTYVLMYVMYVM
jgi:hypothetical protein